MDSDHFKGKSTLEHLKDARLHTAQKLKEPHGVETQNFLDAFIHALSESGFLFGILFVVSLAFSLNRPLFLFGIFFGYVLFRFLQSALDGFARIERLHRVIEEERNEIEHNEAQEREELKAIYQEKGLEGKLLNDVIDILMADSNRLLSIMLTEELGLKLEAYEHPLKQACGALLGASIALIPISFAILFPSLTLGLTASLFCVMLAAFFKAKVERLSKLKTCVWHGANCLLVIGLLYFGLKAVVA